MLNPNACKHKATTVPVPGTVYGIHLAEKIQQIAVPEVFLYRCGIRVRFQLYSQQKS